MRSVSGYCCRIFLVAAAYNFVVITSSQFHGAHAADCNGESGSCTREGSETSQEKLVLYKGGRYKLCRDFAENLRLLADVPKYICKIPIDKKFKDFRKVKWETLDPLENFNIVKEAELYFFDFRWTRKSEAELEAYWAKNADHVLSLARSGSLALGRARFDLNHDGKTDLVYRYDLLRGEKPYCEHEKYPRNGKSRWGYFVRPQDDSELHESFRGLIRRPSEAFFYRGRIYLLVVSSSYIAEPQKNGALIEICDFRWRR